MLRRLIIIIGLVRSITSNYLFRLVKKRYEWHLTFSISTIGLTLVLCENGEEYELFSQILLNHNLKLILRYLSRNYLFNVSNLCCK